MTTAPSSTAAPAHTDPMVPARFRIDRVVAETADTFTLELSRADGGAPFAFAPGQFTMLWVFGVGEVPISISGDPHEPDKLVHTIRAVGAVTGEMARLQAGAIVGVRGPFGSSWPIERARGHDVAIVAGGIGLPPLRPVIYHILANRSDYGRVSLAYGARSPADLLFTSQFDDWRTAGIEVVTTVDTADQTWTGNVGLVTRLLGKLKLDPANTIAMTVGPEIMMRFVVRELLDLGHVPGRQYVSGERNMHCAIGWCGHCLMGPEFICKDGPVFEWQRVARWMTTREA